MRQTVGPYQWGDEVVGCTRWTLYEGVDTRNGRPVWVRRTVDAPRRAAEARSLLRRFSAYPQLTTPLALARDDGGLTSVDRIAGDRTVLARAEVFRGAGQVRVAYDLAVAVEALHAEGLAHGAIGEWTVDVAADGQLWLRGAAESSVLDRTSGRADICAVVAVIERAGGGAVDGRLQESMTALASGGAGLAALIACSASILGIDGTVARRSADVSVAPRRESRRRVSIAPVRAERHEVRPQTGVRNESTQAYVPRHAAVQGDSRLTVAAVLVLVLGSIAAVVVFWPGRPQGESNLGSSVDVPVASQAEHPDWSVYLPALYDTRAEAFAAGDVEMLYQVFTSGSPQLRTDAETIAAVVSQDRRVSGFAPHVIEVKDVEVTGEVATAVVRDEIGPFSITDVYGTELPVDGRPAALTTITLHHQDGSWLIDTAHRAPDE